MTTLKGDIRARRIGEEIEIDAGHASLDGPDHRPGAGAPPAERYTFVSVGNPHCVVEVDDPDVLDLRAVGEPIERHPWFPNRANVEFYRPLQPHEIRMRVWERGAGETLSSGSCSTAAAVAAVVKGQALSPVTVRMDGGSLQIDVADDLAIRLTGPVEQVHEGRFHADFLTTLESL
jgi:diaminopimelate epimerase